MSSIKNHLKNLLASREAFEDLVVVAVFAVGAAININYFLG
ncbi:hypothetical protein [Diaphorobacter sp. J5-51]|nr:hypothetical protein [Diaphorobacter sp. J5-51]